jgi:hypothetical protein
MVERLLNFRQAVGLGLFAPAATARRTAGALFEQRMQGPDFPVMTDRTVLRRRADSDIERDRPLVALCAGILARRDLEVTAFDTYCLSVNQASAAL